MLEVSAYTALVDLSLGVSSPALGLISGAFSLSAVFLVSVVVVVGTVVIAWFLLNTLSAASRFTERSPLNVEGNQC
jgi:hypothetical protein